MKDLNMASCSRQPDRGFQPHFATASVMLCLCLLGSSRAEAGHRIKASGEFIEADLFAGGLLSEEEYFDVQFNVIAWGEWHVSINIETGEFNFHLHADTDDEAYARVKYEGVVPLWVAHTLFQECGFQIVQPEELQINVDQNGHVFLKVTGIGIFVAD